MFTCGFDRSNFSLLISSPLVLSSSFSWLLFHGCRLKAELRTLRTCSLYLCNDLLGNVSRGLGISLKVHRRSGPSLCRRAKVRCVAKHLRQRDKSRYHRDITRTRLHLFDLSAAT